MEIPSVSDVYPIPAYLLFIIQDIDPTFMSSIYFSNMHASSKLEGTSSIPMSYKIIR